MRGRVYGEFDYTGGREDAVVQRSRISHRTARRDVAHVSRRAVSPFLATSSPRSLSCIASESNRGKAGPEGVKKSGTATSGHS